MSDLTLGDRPTDLRVYLTPSSPFVAEMNAPTGLTFGETPVLRFEMPDGTEVSWVSTLLNDGAKAVWTETGTDVNLVISSSRSRKARMTYGLTVWMTGVFEVDGVW